MSDSNPSSSASDLNEAAAVKEDTIEEPFAKKIKLDATELKSSSVEKLEQRLGGILCCAVCLDLPKTAIYQCTNGHLMCAGCFNHLLADARLRGENATCPNCRVDISKTSVSRNLAVEKALSELPSECQYCGEEYPRNSVVRHEQSQCEERMTFCQYSRIGCPWQGPFHEQKEHERNCTHPHNTGAQVLQALDLIEQSKKEEKLLYQSIIEFLSFEKVDFHDLQMKPYRTEEFIHKLFYESGRFQAFDLHWVVKVRINNSQRDPALSCEREMSYQISLKAKTPQPISLSYMILRGPFSDAKVNPKIYKFDFTESETEAPYMKLPLVDTAECNRLLSKKVIDFRLIMFVHQK